MQMLNKQGILELAEIMVCDHKRYNQSKFGEETGQEESETTCGTVCCMAGFAYAKKIGLENFNKEVRFQYNSESFLLSDGTSVSGFTYDCITAGKEMLGINENVASPRIFGYSSAWPRDLADEYTSTGDQKKRVLVALKALSRLRENGTIDSNPKNIHTEIPQIKELEAELGNV
jgi:hypothetical protein